MQPKHLLKIILLSILITLAVSCKENPIEKPLSFQAEYILGENGLDYEFILEQEPGIEEVYVADTLLFTIQSHLYDWGFKVFNKKNLKFLGEFGDRDGPDMVITINYNGQFYVDKDGIKVAISDTNRPIWWIINLSKSIEIGKTVVDKKIELPNGDGLFFRSYLLAPNLFVGNTSFTTNKDVARLKFIDLENDSIWIPPLIPSPKFVNDLNNDQIRFFYQTDLNVSPNGENIISPMYRHNRIDIYTRQGELKKSIIGKSEIIVDNLQKFQILSEGNNMYYHYSVTFDEFFIVTYFNGLASDKRQSKSHLKELRAFDYNGKPLFTIYTPYVLTTISLDFKEGILYGYVYDEQSVIKINIKEQLTKFNLL